MIVISKTFSIDHTYDYSKIAPLKDLIFFDIETTGLTPETSCVYLIGVVYYQQMEWHIRQWFADSLSSEQELLEEFFRFVSNYKVLISFNGESFDLPYLTKCAEHYSLSTPFQNLKSFDIYRKIRPCRRFLGLENMKQRSIETFLNIERSDTYTGAELIDVYQKYLVTQEDSFYQTLLQHNEEDLKGLPSIMPVLSYLDIFDCEWTLSAYSLNREQSIFTSVLECSVKVPVAITYRGSYYSLSFRENQLIIELSVFIGELKYFFENYKDYYYLPDEDTAIHKKVAQYVDKDHRVQATARTCYTRKTSVFLPMIEANDLFQIFLPEYGSKEYYTELIDENDFVLAYLQDLIRPSRHSS